MKLCHLIDIVMGNILLLLVLLEITAPTTIPGCMYSISASDYGEIVQLKIDQQKTNILIKHMYINIFQTTRFNNTMIFFKLIH